VRPALIVVAAPRFDLGPSVGQRQEPVRIQTLVARATIERFYKGIVGRLARAAEVQRDAVLVRPAVECLRDELGAAVDPDRFRSAAKRGDTTIAVPDPRSCKIVNTQPQRRRSLVP
jgi:hypothetical protein